MRNKVKLPKLGETTDSVVVLEWLVTVGDPVEADQAVLSVETDKITTDVTSPVAGVMREQLVCSGDEIATGDHICVVEA